MNELPQEAIHYDRTVSSDGGAGQIFETKMTAYMLLRLFQKSDEFYLANNFEKGEKFDDLVFSSLHGKTWKSWFIQLKHTKKFISVGGLRSKKNTDFSLMKYHASFNKLKQRFDNCKDPDDKIFTHGISSANFIIYTTAVLDATLLKIQRDEYDHYFSSKPDGLVFKFGPKLDDALLTCLKDSDPYLFLNQLLMFTGQANQEEMDDIIEKEIRTIVKVTQTDAKSIYHRILARLQKWFKEGTYLTKKDVANLLSLYDLETRANKKQELGIEFSANFLKTFNRMDLDTNIVALVCKGMTLMGYSALKQQLQDQKCNWLHLTEVTSRPDRYLTWLHSDSQFLIIDCENCSSDVNVDQLTMYIKQHNITGTRYLIFLTSNNNTVGTQLITKTSAKKVTFNCSLRDFTQQTKTMIIDKKIKFQGYMIEISSIFDGSKILEDVFNMDMLNDLLSNREVSVGIKPIPNIPYYISRVLQRRMVLNSSFFKNEMMTVVLVNNSSKNEIATLTNTAVVTMDQLANSGGTILGPLFIVMDSNNDHISRQSIVDKCQTYHEIKKIKNDFQYVKSHNVSPPTQHLHNNKYEFNTSDDMIKSADKIVLITAEPGMGKSTLMVHIAAKTKELDPRIWVVYLSLNDYTNHFSNQNFNENIVKEIVLKAAGVSNNTSKFDRRLFELCYKAGNMVILLDGFDEVSAFYEQQTLFLLNTLRNSNISKIWITTRPVNRELLEKQIFTTSWNLKPFEVKDQQKFLMKYWEYKFKNIDKTNLDLFVKNMLEMADKSINMAQSNFTGIPLHTRMLAEAYNDHVEHYKNTGVILPVESVSILQLFNKFVKTKFDILIKEKRKMDVSNIAVLHDFEESNKVRRQELMKLALLHLFEKKDLIKIVPSITDEEIESLKEKISSGKEVLGIVIEFNEKPEFIHRTFAEYFVAEFFTRHLKQNQTFIMKTIFSQSYSFVRYMFDRMLSDGFKLHTAILDDNTLLVQQLYQNGFNVPDKGGRTPLHICASSKKTEKYMSLLVGAGADVNVADTAFGFLPVQYADNCNCWYALGCLLELNPSYTQYIKNILTYKHEPRWQIFKMSFEHDFLQLYQYLVQNMKISIYDKNDAERDVLIQQDWISKDVKNKGLSEYHLAASHGALNILKYKLSVFDSLAKHIKIQCIKICLGQVDDKNRTPLHYATIHKKCEMVQFLIENGTDVKTLDADGKSSLHYAVEQKRKDLVITHLNNLINVSSGSKYIEKPLLHALRAPGINGTEIVEVFLQYNPELINYTDVDCTSLLMWAAKYTNINTIKLLLNHGVYVNVKNNKGYTALHSAVHSSTAAQCINVLLQVGADVNSKTAEGSTPLHFAARTSKQNVIQVLLQNHADINCLDNNNRTVLHYAAGKLTIEMFKLLVQKGADWNVVDSKGKTFLDEMKVQNVPTYDVINQCVTALKQNVTKNISLEELFKQTETQKEIVKPTKTIVKKKKKTAQTVQPTSPTKVETKNPLPLKTKT